MTDAGQGSSYSCPASDGRGKKFLRKLSKSLDKEARKIYNVRELAIRATEC